MRAYAQHLFGKETVTMSFLVVSALCPIGHP